MFGLGLPNAAALQKKLADLPIAIYEADETVLTAASTTGRLLILKEGAVAIVKEGVEVGNVAEPGAVFGELSVLVDRPHRADVIAVKTSQFYVASATLFMRDPVALLYVAAVMARRLDRANEGVIELKRQVHAEEPGIALGKTVAKIERLLSAGGSAVSAVRVDFNPLLRRPPWRARTVANCWSYSRVVSSNRDRHCRT